MPNKLFSLLLFFILFLSHLHAEVVVIVRQHANSQGNYIRLCDIARLDGPKEQVKEIGKTILVKSPAYGESKEITRWEIENRLIEMGYQAKVVFSGKDSIIVTNGQANIKHYNVNNDFSYGQQEELVFSQSLNDKVTVNKKLNLNQPSEDLVVIDLSSQAKQDNLQAKKSLNSLSKSKEDKFLNTRNKELINQAISSYLSNLYGRADIELEVNILNIKGDTEINLESIKNISAVQGKVPGKAVFKLDCQDNSDSEESLTVSTNIDVIALAPIAIRPLAKGVVIDVRDIRLSKVKMKSGEAYLAPKLEAAIGNQTKVFIPAGSPILANQIEETLAVKRGNIVSVDTSGRGWRLQGNAKALSDGKVGEIVKVEDTSTKTQYMAIITGYGTVSAVTR